MRDTEERQKDAGDHDSRKPEKQRPELAEEVLHDGRRQDADDKKHRESQLCKQDRIHLTKEGVSFIRASGAHQRTYKIPLGLNIMLGI